jgi:hypothetical protein
MAGSKRKSSRWQAVPPALRPFAWNLGDEVNAFGRKQIALNVIERGRAWHWTRLPKGWFDLKFCLKHGQGKTKRTLREWFGQEP